MYTITGNKVGDSKVQVTYGDYTYDIGTIKVWGANIPTVVRPIDTNSLDEIVEIENEDSMIGVVGINDADHTLIPPSYIKVKYHNSNTTGEITYENLGSDEIPSIKVSSGNNFITVNKSNNEKTTFTTNYAASEWITIDVTGDRSNELQLNVVDDMETVTINRINPEDPSWAIPNFEVSSANDNIATFKKYSGNNFMIHGVSPGITKFKVSYNNKIKEFGQLCSCLLSGVGSSITRPADSSNIKSINFADAYNDMTLMVGNSKAINIPKYLKLSYYNKDAQLKLKIEGCPEEPIIITDDKDNKLINISNIRKDNNLPNTYIADITAKANTLASDTTSHIPLTLIVKVKDFQIFKKQISIFDDNSQFVINDPNNYQYSIENTDIAQIIRI